MTEIYKFAFPFDDAISHTILKLYHFYEQIQDRSAFFIST
jgi:hypothetical protein